ncbi:hypothetical protein Droror1_Dr00026472 [Drosera rotundifolia]
MMPLQACSKSCDVLKNAEMDHEGAQVWLIVTNRLPFLRPWGLCVAIFVGTNGETYFNTAALVACVQNSPKSRGLEVGILKGFAGLSGATLSEVYSMFNSSSRIYGIGKCFGSCYTFVLLSYNNAKCMNFIPLYKQLNLGVS